MPPRPIYSFVASDGTNIHIDIDPLRTHALRSGLEIIRVPVEPDVALSFYKGNCLNLERLAVMSRDRTLYAEPILFGQYDSSIDVILIDGHHRYALAAERRDPYIASILIPEIEWRLFQLPLPTLTIDELRSLPPKSTRHY